MREVRLLRTADFGCSRSRSFRTVFGVSLRFLLAILVVCTTGLEVHATLARLSFPTREEACMRIGNC
jgi:hypothetical protein